MGQNMTMPGPETELCGAEWHSCAVRRRRSAPGALDFAPGPFGGRPSGRVWNIYSVALNGAPGGFGVRKGRKAAKYQLSAALGRPLCGPPWPVRMLESDEGFGKFPRLRRARLWWAYYARRVLLRHPPSPVLSYITMLYASCSVRFRHTPLEVTPLSRPLPPTHLLPLYY